MAAVVLAAIGTAGLWAQSEGVPSEEGLFYDTVDVNVVNVEVYVTDKDGNHVLGLGKDDFELLVDDKPMLISNFFSVEGGQAKIEEGIPEPPEPKPEDEFVRPGQIEDPGIPEEQRLHLVVYVDNFNIHPFTRNKVFRFARTFLRQRLHRGDRVMLISYDRSLKVRHPFTADPELIAAALYELEEVSGWRNTADSERRDILKDVYDADDIYQVRARAMQYAESLYNDLRFSIDALKEVVENLAGLPGRKAILYVCDGLPMRPGEDVIWALDDHFHDSSVLMETHRFDASRLFQELASKANANRVTFYTVDAAGLRAYTYMDASNATLAGGSNIDQIHFANLQSSLVFLADQTGGMAILNTNDFGEGLDRVAGDFDTYYSLGFTTADASSGRYHDFKVKVKDGRKLDVRVRRGFRDKPVSTRMTETTLAALNFGYESNPLGIVLEVGRRTPLEKGTYNVELDVKIPIGKLSYLPQQEMQRGRIRIYISARDSEGRMAPVSEVPVPIDIPTAEFEKAQDQYFRYAMTVQMRQGRQIVAVGVRDEIGAVSGFVTRGLSVGS